MRRPGRCGGLADAAAMMREICGDDANASSEDEGNGYCGQKAKLCAAQRLLRLMRTKRVLGTTGDAPKVIMRLLAQPSVALRRTGMHLLAASIAGSRSSIEKEDAVIDCMLPFAHEDGNAGVREAALAALATVLRRKVLPTRAASVVATAVAALHDDYEDVKIAAVRLLAVIAAQLASSVRRHESTMSDVFIHLCVATADVSPKVRAEALNRLGTMRGVDSSPLLRAVERDTEVGPHGCTPSGTVGGHLVHSSAPEEGVRGTFVHCLQDDHAAVRTAAVDALCELSMHNKCISEKAADLLVRARPICGSHRDFPSPVVKSLCPPGLG